MEVKRRKHDELRPIHMQKRAKRPNESKAWELEMMAMLEAAKPVPYAVAQLAIMAVEGGVIVGVRIQDGHSSEFYKEGSIFVDKAPNIRQAMPTVIREIHKHSGVECLTIKSAQASIYGFGIRDMLPYAENTRIYSVDIPAHFLLKLHLLANKALNRKTMWRDVTE